MLKLSLLCALLLWLHFSIYAQGADSITTVTTQAGTVYTGKLIENVEDQYIRIQTSDNNVYRISYDMIRDVRTVPIGSPNVALPPKAPEVHKVELSSIKIPEELERKKKKGLVLIAIGGGLMGVGAILIAASPPGTIQTTSQPGNASVNFTGVAAVGFLMELAGIPTMIVGAVKLGVNKRKIHRYVMLHEN